MSKSKASDKWLGTWLDTIFVDSYDDGLLCLHTDASHTLLSGSRIEFHDLGESRGTSQAGVHAPQTHSLPAIDASIVCLQGQILDACQADTASLKTGRIFKATSEILLFLG